MISQTVKIVNQLGLHARASAKLTQLAGEFPCEIFIEKKVVKSTLKVLWGL
jgi:phosphocarrier protein